MASGWILPLFRDAGVGGRDALLAWSMCSFTLLALHVVPHYLQMGAAQNRRIALLSLGGGLASVITAYLVLPLGAETVMASRCLQGLVLFASWPNLWRLFFARDTVPASAH